MKTIFFLAIFVYALAAMALPPTIPTVYRSVTVGTNGVLAAADTNLFWSNINSLTNALAQASYGLIGGKITNIQPDKIYVTSTFSNFFGVGESSVTNSPNIFGPWLGFDYVNQAFNALPRYVGQRTKVGGGTVVVLGINYYPRCIYATNGDENYSIKITSPNFLGGALVCTAAPALTAGSPSYDAPYAGCVFEMENIILSTTRNDPTNLIQIYGFCDSGIFSHNWFGLWSSITNNQNPTSVNSWVGLSTPTTGASVAARRNLVVNVEAGADDRFVFKDNFFYGLASVFINVDHLAMSRNNYYYCAGDTDWNQTNFIYGRAALVLGYNVNSNIRMDANFFYGCAAAYLTGCPVGNAYSYNDHFESTPINMISCWLADVQEWGDLIQVFPNDKPEVDGVLQSSDSLPFQWPGHPSYAGGYFSAYTSNKTNSVIFYTGLPGQKTLNLNGYAVAINGQTPVTTSGNTITNGGVAWYFLATNSTPAIAAPSGSFCSTTNGQFYVRSNTVWLLK